MWVTVNTLSWSEVCRIQNKSVQLILWGCWYPLTDLRSSFLIWCSADGTTEVRVTVNFDPWSTVVCSASGQYFSHLSYTSSRNKLLCWRAKKWKHADTFFVQNIYIPGIDLIPLVKIIYDIYTLRLIRGRARAKATTRDDGPIRRELWKCPRDNSVT